MITLNADKHTFMRQFHKPGDQKRSVVIVDNSNLNDWLTASHDQARQLIKLSPDNYLEVAK
jgi:putative SOS response-associated peptidase YedK